jgi:hypothetical protein
MYVVIYNFIFLWYDTKAALKMDGAGASETLAPVYHYALLLCSRRWVLSAPP